MDELSRVQIVVALSASIVAAIMDLWKFKVYNGLTIPLLVAGLVYHGVFRGTSGLTSSGLGMLFGFGVLLLFYVMGGVGAGDVKLMAAIGAWLGMEVTLYVFVVSALAGGLYATVLILLRGRGAVWETWLNMQIFWHRLSTLSHYLAREDSVEALSREDRRRRAVPFAAMVAIGVLTTILLNLRQ